MYHIYRCSSTKFVWVALNSTIYQASQFGTNSSNLYLSFLQLR